MCWCSLKFLLTKKLIIKTLTKSLLMDDELFFAVCLTDERHTAQKMKFSMKGFFSEYDQILRNLRIWSHLLKKSFMENFIFCTVAISLFSSRNYCQRFSPLQISDIRKQDWNVRRTWVQALSNEVVQLY